MKKKFIIPTKHKYPLNSKENVNSLEKPQETSQEKSFSPPPSVTMVTRSIQTAEEGQNRKKVGLKRFSLPKKSSQTISNHSLSKPDATNSYKNIPPPHSSKIAYEKKAYSFKKGFKLESPISESPSYGILTKLLSNKSQLLGSDTYGKKLIFTQKRNRLGYVINEPFNSLIHPHFTKNRRLKFTTESSERRYRRKLLIV